MISMFSPRSIKGVFVEDNQATIRILENGKSPTFRHTDKTQRVTPGPFTVEVRMEKPVGLHGSRLRPIPGEKVETGLPGQQMQEK